MPRGNYTIQRSCEECGKIFTPPTLMSKYCCPACSKRAYKKRQITPCKDDVLKRAFLFSILTGLRHSDIQTLKWKQIQQTSKGTWQAVVVQQKTKVPDYKPVIQQALQLCGERPSNDEALVFEGLTDASWISRPLKVWIEASGIKKHITFHTARHTWATTAYYCEIHPGIISEAMGHSSITVTETYLKPFRSKKIDEANRQVVDFVRRSAGGLIS